MGLENFSYSHTIGIASFLGRGFMNPVDVRLDSKGKLFVLSRSNAANKDVRISVQTLDSEYMYEFGRWGTEPGQTTQPTAIVLDGDDRVFVPDEFMHNVSIFNREGEFLERWGEFGTGAGQFNRPSGIAIDSDGNLHIVENYRCPPLGLLRPFVRRCSGRSRNAFQQSPEPTRVFIRSRDPHLAVAGLRLDPQLLEVWVGRERVDQAELTVL